MYKLLFVVAAGFLIFFIGSWLGSSVSAGTPNGLVILAVFVTLVWVGYLSFRRPHGNDGQKFFEKVVSVAVSAFLLAALGLGYR